MTCRLPATLALLVAAGCAEDGGATRPPDPAFFGDEARFVGEWFGEVDGRPGTLTVEALGGGRLRGLFESDDRATMLVLLVEARPGPQGTPNVVPFAWQDGRGGRGRGWLRINREGNALDGAHGFDERVDGAGAWLFVRVE